jgi:hypothetical protein
VYGFILIGALNGVLIMQRKSGEKSWNPLKKSAENGNF